MKDTANNTLIHFFCIVLLLASLIDLSEARRPKTNCGLKCFRWRKCMGQLSGDENRPHELGNTGQIVLNTCNSGACDCEEEERKKTSTTTTTTTIAPRASSLERSSFAKNRYVRKNLKTLTSRSRNLTRPKSSRLEKYTSPSVQDRELESQDASENAPALQVSPHRFRPIQRRLFRQRY
ncbi:hypothetical protein TCAL_17341 [Tigriopus californicus]|uniref:Uncharacterized protein n=1 Tax=Tigriopus californicus TaxID=6832 RepID=A0A553NZY3_TIGCA|nr:uncharacterized protein LOC131886432 [Tigriopus californicus]TRY71004.1 hypothetical protein TCAL_17341 [Tigriopus californicus]